MKLQYLTSLQIVWFGAEENAGRMPGCRDEAARERVLIRVGRVRLDFILRTSLEPLKPTRVLE